MRALSIDDPMTHHRNPLPPMEALVGALPGALYTFVAANDGTRYFPFVSPACAEIYGFSAEAAMADARHLHEAIHPMDRRSFHEAGRRSYERMETLRWEGRIVRPDGEIRLVTIISRPQPHPDDDSTLWHGLVIERSTAADHELTPEAASGAPAPAPAPAPIDGDTLAILGHDIGTPLTAITAAADLAMEVLESPAGFGNERHQDLVRLLWAVQRNAARLALLRDGLLNMVNSDAGRLVATPAPVLLRPRLEAAVALVAGRSRTDLECDPELTCWAQPSHLDQMILNLLANADKYAGGAVAVRATLDGDNVAIVVEDHGPGVPVAFRDELFTRFTRHETTAALPGTGLGLSIVHELATINKGSVAFAPGPGKGARFTITLPSRFDHDTTSTTTNTTTESTAGLRSVR